MTPTTRIRLDHQDGLADVVLDGAPLNVLGQDAQRRLGEVVEQLWADPTITAVLVSGAGERAFSVGADLNEVELGVRADPWGGSAWEDHWTTRLAQLPALTIAVVNGHCLGGGLELALACDLRVAGPSARFGLPEARLGLMPGMGGTARLPRLVGRPWATWMTMTGEVVDAELARSIGLVQVVAQDPMARARELAVAATRTAPRSRRALKKLVVDGPATVAGAMAAERDAWRALAATQDARTGVEAFRAKRTPEFDDA